MQPRNAMFPDVWGSSQLLAEDTDWFLEQAAAQVASLAMAKGPWVDSEVVAVLLWSSNVGENREVSFSAF